MTFIEIEMEKYWIRTIDVVIHVFLSQLASLLLFDTVALDTFGLTYVWLQLSETDPGGPQGPQGWLTNTPGQSWKPPYTWTFY